MPLCIEPQSSLSMKPNRVMSVPRLRAGTSFRLKNGGAKKSLARGGANARRNRKPHGVLCIQLITILMVNVASVKKMHCLRAYFIRFLFIFSRVRIKTPNTDIVCMGNGACLHHSRFAVREHVDKFSAAVSDKAKTARETVFNSVRRYRTEFVHRLQIQRFRSCPSRPELLYTECMSKFSTKLRRADILLEHVEMFFSKAVNILALSVDISI